MSGYIQEFFAPPAAKSPPPPAPKPVVKPEPVKATVKPPDVVKVGETEQDKRLKKVRTGAGRGARILSSSVLGSAPTTIKTLLGS